MTPSARIQSAIELLDLVIAAARDAGPAADTLIATYFKTRRYAGSGDRRAVRDLVYQAIRRSGERPASGRAAMLGVVQDQPELGNLFNGSPHGPTPISDDEAVAPAGLVPAWLSPRLRHVDTPALLDRAPLDLRANRLKASREQLLPAFPRAVPTRYAPDGLRLAEPVRVEGHPAYRAGMVEIQDEGSQLIALACAAREGETIVDLCAGAGGKTLALAAGMGGKDRLIACDTDRARLSRLPERAARAGANLIETRLLNPGAEAVALADLAGRADAVLIDAPCSGTGTWRRNPEARWRLTPERLERLTALQARLIELGATLVRPGGRLIYAVCSLLDEEGADQLGAFLDRQQGWRVVRPIVGPGVDRGGGVLLSPAADGMDGFFVARLERAC